MDRFWQTKKAQYDTACDDKLAVDHYIKRGYFGSLSVDRYAESDRLWRHSGTSCCQSIGAYFTGKYQKAGAEDAGTVVTSGVLGFLCGTVRFRKPAADAGNRRACTYYQWHITGKITIATDANAKNSLLCFGNRKRINLCGKAG